MKKVLFFTAVAAVLAFTACDRGSKKQPIVYDTPIYEDLAMKFEVKADEDINKLDVLYGFSSFELTETGKFIIVDDKEGVITDHVINIDEIKKAGKIETVKCGEWGEVAIDPAISTKAATKYTITFKPADALPIVVVAEEKEQDSEVEDEFMEKLARDWKVTNTTISVSGGDLPSALGVAKNFTGCNLGEIKEYLEKTSGSKIKMDEINGFIVDYISFTEAGSFIVKFTNKKAVAADWTLNKDKSFTYEVSGSQAGYGFFNGSATGIVNFDELNNLSVVINANVDMNNSAYKGKVTFLLEQVK